MTSRFFKQTLMISLLICITSQFFQANAQELDIEYQDVNCLSKLQGVILFDVENDNIYTCEDIVRLFPILSDESKYDDVISDKYGKFLLISDKSSVRHNSTRTLLHIKQGQPITDWTQTFPSELCRSLISSTGSVFNICIKDVYVTRVEEIDYVEIIKINGDRVVIDSLGDNLPLKSERMLLPSYSSQWSDLGDIFTLYFHQYDYVNDIGYNVFLFIDCEGKIINTFTYAGEVKSFKLLNDSNYFFIMKQSNNSMDKFVVDRNSGKLLYMQNDITSILSVHDGFIYYSNENGIYRERLNSDEKANRIINIDKFIPIIQYFDNEHIILYAINGIYDQNSLSRSYSLLIKSICTKDNSVKSLELTGSYKEQQRTYNIIFSRKHHRLFVTFASRIATISY